ncbi:MAG: aldehyde dehydrogenase family protein [Gemmatimonadetes bacterium]|nr:aldehyde dehydrogenase family protein [Gemmatimonadota bacterium]
MEESVESEEQGRASTTAPERRQREARREPGTAGGAPFRERPDAPVPGSDGRGGPLDLDTSGVDPEARGRTREGHRVRRGVLEVHRPADGSLIGEVPISLQVEVLEAVERARSVQIHWIGLDSEQRITQLKRLTEQVGERADEIAEVVQAETGKPLVEAVTEVLVTLDLLKYYEEVAPRIMRRQWVKTNWLIGKSAYIYREPFGVIGAITPWNYPLILAMDAVAAALFAGNAVVVKPSEYTPFTALKVKELCRDAGLPDGLVEIVPGDGLTGEALVGSGVDKVVFTGSSKTGRQVMAKAAETLTPVALELGGKDPAVVLDDADLDRAARGVVFGAFFNAGQTCLSTERAYVADAIYDEFVERVTELAGELRAGSEGEYDVGPMITSRQLTLVEEQIEDALLRGARLTTGGERLEPGSNVFRPTVLVDVDASMRVLWEETFGPVLPIVRVANDEEAVRMVNVSPYGLFASVWTEDRERGERVGERLRAGGISINDTLSHYAVPGLPMGGVGESGFGRRRGVAGLEEMSRARTVLIHRTGLGRELWWFPYTKKGMRLVRALIQYRQSSGLARVWAGIRGFFRRRAR